MKKGISQFIVGYFPLKGEILEVSEKNKKQDAAKTVKINIGKSVGVSKGYKFLISDYNSNKLDIIAEEVFEDYSLCRVHENERILDDFLAGKHLKVKTIYIPKL